MAEQAQQAKPAKDGSDRPAAAEKPAEQKFAVSQIIEEGLGGIPGHRLAGAFAGEHDKEVTIAQAQKRVEEWLQTPAEEA